jgi:plasmid rolling circle replication initiator protein Rep
MDVIEDDYAFIFLTLTVKNCKGEDLIQQIDNLVSAYKTLCLRTRFKNVVQGWARCFEITHNWRTREYHPHFHCILAVRKDYFTSDLFIPQNDWCLLWQSCLGVDYKPIVDVRVFKDSEKGKGKEIAEVAKYTIKSSNIMANLQDISEYSQDVQKAVKQYTDSITDEIVMTLDTALTKRKLLSYGGALKRTRRELKLKDDDDLIHTGIDETQNIMEYEIERYRWDIGHRNYVKIIEGSEFYGYDVDYKTGGNTG